MISDRIITPIIAFFHWNACRLNKVIITHPVDARIVRTRTASKGLYLPPYAVMSHFPATEISAKQYSLEADIITGWRPRTKILGPIPLNCDDRLVDEIVEELTSFGSRHRERVVYLGTQGAIQGGGLPAVSNCTRRCLAAIPSSTKAPSTPTTPTWQPTSASSTPTSSPKTRASSRA